MFSSKQARIGIIRGDLQSSFLTDVFDEPELSGFTTVFIIDLNELRRSAQFKLVKAFYRYLFRCSPSESFNRAEQFSVFATARIRRFSHLVALDNRLELLASIAEALRPSGTRCFVIQLGTNPKYYSGDTRPTSRTVPVKMLCWGSREVSEYVRSGLVPEEFSIVGSIKLSIAKRRNTNRPVKKWDICIVSQFRPMPPDPNRISELNRSEAESMPELIRLLRPVIIRNHLQVIVAVKAGRRVYKSSLEQQEIAFYQSALGDIAEIDLSRNPYASYALAESSKLVIGRNSALLTEMLSSQSRVLFVNPTEQTMFNAPEGMPHTLETPSATELESKVLDMLNQSSDEYARTVEFAIPKYCVRFDDTFLEVGRALGLSQ